MNKICQVLKTIPVKVTMVSTYQAYLIQRVLHIYFQFGFGFIQILTNKIQGYNKCTGRPKTKTNVYNYSELEMASLTGMNNFIST